MKVLGEMVCEECSEHFTSAASLLKHFAIHAIEAFTTIANSDLDEVRHEEKRNFIQRSIPDLHPISRHINKDFQSKLVNPLTVCEVTLNETKLQDTSLPSNINDNDKIRKYQCKYCKKRFGWSTDLKRHILIHTGERPFSCNICMSTFTRNFQLQKHISKCHKYKYDKSLRFLILNQFI
ncbi:hypothetical protein HHI36_010386 [Cryptolaemus montrouzieri]|uniref:C2H2-type domain-containing protein n=1 Tax=Cryptolaemus montrouzieri TaxID=559131 RepID=A0ABD2MIM4_9CUCU